MKRFACFISILLLPFSLLGQDTSQNKKNPHVEVYFDPYLGLTNKDFSNDSPELAFAYGSGVNFTWRLTKTIDLKSGAAFYTDYHFKKVFAPCEALSYGCLPLRKIKNRYIELPVLVQYRIVKKDSKIKTSITGGFINQLLIHQTKTAYTKDKDIKRAGPEGYKLNYWGGDFYVGLQLSKAVCNNTINLFLEPNFRYSTTAFKDSPIEYKYYPKLGLRSGVKF